MAPCAFIGECRLSHLQALDQVTGVRKGGDRLAPRIGRIAPARIASAMVRVQMRRQHDIDILRPETDPPHIRLQPPAAVVHAKPAPVLGAYLVSLARVHQDQPIRRLNQQAAHLSRDPVLLVRTNDPLPQYARHETKETAAVDQLLAVADNMTLNRTDLECIWHSLFL